MPAAFVGLIVLASMDATKLKVDTSQVDNFAAAEPIRLADEKINAEFAGTAFLELQEHVSKTVSIANYISLRGSIILAGDAFYGSAEGIFGQFLERDRVTLTVEYNL